MNRFLNNNLAWKIVSLILAAMLWIFVINTQDPIVVSEINNLPIRIEGIDTLEQKGFLLMNEADIQNMNVKLSVQGPRLEIEALLETINRSTKDPAWEILLDLTSYANTLDPEDAAQEIEKPVLVDIVGEKGNLNIESIQPVSISVILAKESTEVRSIHTNIQGVSSSEYIAQDPILKPSEVKLTGAQSDIEDVQRVVVDVNIDNFSEDILTYTVPVKLLDAEGFEVVGVKPEPEEIEVVLPIGKKKVIPLQARFEGYLPDNYIQSNVIITPKQITVIGKADIVDTLGAISLEAISLNNMIQSGTFQVEPILPVGIERIDTNDIVVTVEIQKEIAYEYTIDTGELDLDIIGLPQAYTLDIKQPVISISLEGTPENLLEFNVKEVKATLDLRQIGTTVPGVYTVVLNVDIPDNLKVTESGNVSLTIEIVDPNAVPEQESEENQETEEEIPPEGEDLEDEQAEEEIPGENAPGEDSSQSELPNTEDESSTNENLQGATNENIEAEESVGESTEYKETTEENIEIEDEEMIDESNEEETVEKEPSKKILTQMRE